MLLTQAGSETLRSLEPAIVLIAISSIVFWRVTLRILAIALVALVVSGAVLVWTAMQHVTG
jgi:hypothetical protein